MSAGSNDARIARLVESMRQDGFDAFVAATPVTMGYLQGFGEGSHERFLILAVRANGDVRMICPALSATQARRSGISDVRPWADGEDPAEHFRELAADWELRSAILAVDDQMPAFMLLAMQEELPAALFKPGQPTLSRLMRVKDPAEIAAMREAGRIADEAFEYVKGRIQAGMTERMVEQTLQDAMARFGGRPTFCIVAAGPNGAEPHHAGDETVITRGDVLIMDFGCSVDGYQSDITRTVCCGEASDEAKAVYDTVYGAQAAGRAAVRPGIPAEEIDAAARKVIEDAGYGSYFIHRTGHGIGLNGHEDPYIVKGNREPVEIGECFSVEPGVYLPGKFGVRIENIVVVTESGADSMNEEPSPHILEL